MIPVTEMDYTSRKCVGMGLPPRKVKSVMFSGVEFLVPSSIEPSKENSDADK